MIAIGVIIMVIGFLGCCGAIRENRCLLLLVRVNAWFRVFQLPEFSLSGSNLSTFNLAD